MGLGTQKRKLERKNTLFHPNFVEGLDTQLEEGFFSVPVSYPKELPKFKLVGLTLCRLRNETI